MIQAVSTALLKPGVCQLSCPPVNKVSWHTAAPTPSLFPGPFGDTQRRLGAGAAPGAAETKTSFSPPCTGLVPALPKPTRLPTLSPQARSPVPAAVWAGP